MSNKERHRVIEKRFLYRYPRPVAKSTVGNKELKKAKRMVQQDYTRWANKYVKKWGVIGPDGHPQASLPKVSDNMYELIMALKVGWIVHKWRARWEALIRSVHPKSILLRLIGTKDNVAS